VVAPLTVCSASGRIAPFQIAAAWNPFLERGTPSSYAPGCPLTRQDTERPCPAGRNVSQVTALPSAPTGRVGFPGSGATTRSCVFVRGAGRPRRGGVPVLRAAQPLRGPVGQPGADRRDAAGNLAGRLTRPPGPFHGAVIDWIKVAFYPPAFNLADVALRAGVAIPVIRVLYQASRADPRVPPAARHRLRISPAHGRPLRRTCPVPPGKWPTSVPGRGARRQAPRRRAPGRRPRGPARLHRRAAGDLAPGLVIHPPRAPEQGTAPANRRRGHLPRPGPPSSASPAPCPWNTTTNGPKPAASWAWRSSPEPGPHRARTRPGR